jgi:hypothetical protein
MSRRGSSLKRSPLMGYLQMGKINYTQMMKEYWNTYILRKW